MMRTPGIDVVVSTPPDTTGAIALQLSGASVTVTDGTGTAVFQVADARVHGLELHFAPGSQTHTITIERLSGVSEAYVTAISKLDLTPISGMQIISTGPITTGQEMDTPLTATMPGLTLPLSIPNSSPNGIILASFPGAPVAAQMIDSNGVSLATLSAGQIDGLSLTLDSGDYELTLLNTNTNINTLAAVSVSPAIQPFLPPAMMTEPAAVATQVDTSAPSAPNCTVQISESSINLRSGPGTGYSVLSYGFRGDVLTVGGTNSEDSWLLVGNAQGSAWMDKTLGSLDGVCDNLPIYNIPYREASAPSIIIQPSTGAGSNGSSAFGGEQHENDHGHEQEGDD